MIQKADDSLKPVESNWRSLAAWVVRVLGLLCVVATLLPLIPTGYWLVRGWDFPRFQLGVLLAVLVLLVILWRGQFRSRTELAAWLIVLVGACTWQWSHVIRFTSVWPAEVERPHANQSEIRLLVANLAYENEAREVVAAELREIDADVLILIEVNEAWSSGLVGLRSHYDFHHDEVRGDGLGLSVWSKTSVRSADTRFLVEDRRPSIWVELVHEGKPINLVAVHPTPPGLKDSTGETRRDSRVRDAELVLIANEIADRKNEAWIVAGDFNDVAWSHTTRLFKRLSGLKDPRIGRSFMGTFHADYPLVRFPIDHVFVSDGFAIADLSRHVITGSDHFGISATIAMGQPAAGVTPEPEGDDRSEAAEIVDEGQDDADERGVATDEETRGNGR